MGYHKDELKNQRKKFQSMNGGEDKKIIKFKNLMNGLINKAVIS